MATENKVLDLIVDENVAYSLLLQFTDVDDSTNPWTEVPVDLTGVTLRASIKNSLEDSGIKLADFSTGIVNAAGGKASMGLTASVISSILANASTERDKYNPRLRFAGYYDVILSKNNSPASYSRILEGKVYISEGVTV